MQSMHHGHAWRRAAAGETRWKPAARALEITRRRGLAGKPGCMGRNAACRRNLCLEE
ncbi:hypothetical protein L557_0431 [Bordetella pertussis STO1-CNMC-0004]|nr:hypothetical protein L569_0459 [Bordetella pertussis 2250905]ETH05626.1 hypothetical protein L570_0427 [Bordetella pertussis 2356847]ETH06812.1 hypothetical protein L571_0434 [Bordetella pertussis 2371640]ETH22812.1 hypothetical protein L564_0434 [Bordetella pertussis CHLA-15]ETH28484.1 hypothetical protein L565_0429 [Bordetella pertussis CHLA-20]ETH35284.1 hypothetical protein L546_0452 [Bordetella pertussis H897]ETH76923.1 hypothetical protein L555_0428 [Bordetella pertussis STO1-CHOC-00